MTFIWLKIPKKIISLGNDVEHAGRDRDAWNQQT
jgi:hypothetical protein